MSILAGLDAIFDRHLQFEHIGSSPHYYHKTSALGLNTGRPRGFDAQKLLVEAFTLSCSTWSARHGSRAKGRRGRTGASTSSSATLPTTQASRSHFERAIVRVTGSRLGQPGAYGLGLMGSHG